MILRTFVLLRNCIIFIFIKFVSCERPSELFYLLILLDWWK